MVMPEFSFERVSLRAMSIGTGFTIKTFRLAADSKPEKFGTQTLSDADGRMLSLDKTVEQKIHWLSSQNHWLAWIDRAGAELACFDAPPPKEILGMLVAEWEAGQIETETSDPGIPGSSSTSTRL